MSRWDGLKPQRPSRVESSKPTKGPRRPKESTPPDHRHQEPLQRSAEKSNERGGNIGTNSRKPWRQASRSTAANEWDALVRLLSSDQMSNDIACEDSAAVNSLHNTIDKAVKFLETSNRGNLILNNAATGISHLVHILIISSNDRLKHIIVELLHQIANKYGKIHEVDLRSSIASLAAHCNQAPMDTPCLQALASMITPALSQLAPEATANDIITQVFLSYLETSDDESDMKTTVIVIDTIGSVLSDPQHAASMLDFLIQDISQDGSEQRAINPRRSRVLGALQRCLFHQKPVVTVSACKSLEICIAAIAKLKTKDASTFDMDHSLADALHKLATAVLIENKLTYRDLRSQVLKLLTSFIRCYPGKSGSIGTVLLFGSYGATVKTRPPKKCARCNFIAGGERPSILIEIIHSSTIVVEERIAAMQCVTSLLTGMPIKKWLGTSQYSTKPSQLTAVSGFARVVLAAFRSLLCVTRCIFTKSAEQSKPGFVQAYCQLAQRIMNEIPYVEADLCAYGKDLWHALFSIVVDQKNDHTIRVALKDALVESLGGQMTPNGSTSQMCDPATIWFDDPSSAKSIEQLFVDGFGLDHESKARDMTLIFLIDIVRVKHSMAVEYWTRFQDLIDQLWKSSRQEHNDIALQCLGAVLSGRQKWIDSDEKLPVLSTASFVHFFGVMLQEALPAKSAATRCLAVVCYSSLCEDDWLHFDGVGGGFNEHLRRLLERCSLMNENRPGEANAKVRSGACKAISEFCGRYFHNNEHRQNPNSNDILLLNLVNQTMVGNLSDTNPQVRSMSLLALGNAAHSLCQREDRGIIATLDLHSIIFHVEKCLEDSNDKVVSNAIRTLGHLCVLYFGTDRNVDADEEARSYYAMYQTLLQKLKEKLLFSLRAATGIECTMSWKQRSSAKKHGWGACNALAQLFASPLFGSSQNAKVARDGIETLVECITSAKHLNEKVVIAAIRAIQVIEPTSFASITNGSGLIGTVVAAIVVDCQLGNQGRNNRHTTLQVEMRSLLRYLLPCASIADACTVLKTADVTLSDIQAFYQWMVEEEVDGHSFEIFALALQRPGLQLDASLEQSFASRALNQYNRYQSAKLAQEGAADTRDDDEL